MLADALLYDLNPLYYTVPSTGTPENDFRTLYTQLNSRELTRLAHRPEVMIRQCSIGVPELFPQDECGSLRSVGGVPLLSPTNGVCYTFNFHGGKHPPRPVVTTLYPGSNYGLKLQLNIEGTLESHRLERTFVDRDSQFFH